MKKYVIGADIGGQSVKLGLLDTSGNIIQTDSIKTIGGMGILSDINSAVDFILKDCGIDASDVKGIGFGIPGPVIGGQNVGVCVNIPDFDNFNLTEEFSKLSPLPVIATNDANAAALGEMWVGGGVGYKNMIFVTLGTGVGAGIIIDGRLINGAHGCAGELGHIKLNPDEPEVCGCGGRGCTEQYSAANGIVRTARRIMAQSDAPSVLRINENLTPKHIFDAAKDGDGTALETVEVFADCLGRALAAGACVCDPEIIVLGGGISKSGEFMLDFVKKAYKKYAYLETCKTEFALAKLGNDAGIYGAAKLALDM